MRIVAIFCRVLGRGAALACAVLAGLFVGGCGSPSPGPSAGLDAFTSHLDRRLPQWMTEYGVPGATVALVRDGELVWSGAYGYADRQNDREITVDAVFRAESISKSVTAWGVLRLVEEGRLELDAPMQRYLDDWPFARSGYTEEEVTVRRLLSHTAGLSRGPLGAEYEPGTERPTLRAYLRRDLRRVRPPGTEFEYSNTGFDLLQLLVEEVTNRDFARFMEEGVLRPLGMQRATFAWRDTLRAAVPTGYDREGRPVPVYLYPGAASGGLFTDVEDLARFVEAELMGGPGSKRALLSQESIRDLHSPEVPILGLFGVVADAYGLGHFIEQLPAGRRAVWHGGQGHGWMTHFHAVPATGDGIVILTNSERSWPLMAEVLGDWGRWAGIGEVKMGRITKATTVLRVVTGLALLVSVWLLFGLVRGLWEGTRLWGPLSGSSRVLRWIRVLLALGVLGALLWNAAQPYSFAPSIFPTTYETAAIVFCTWAVLTIASVLFPRRPR